MILNWQLKYPFLVPLLQYECLRAYRVSEKAILYGLAVCLNNDFC